MLTLNHDDEFERRFSYRWINGAFTATELPRPSLLAAIKDTTVLQAYNAWPEFRAHADQAIALLHPVDVPELANRVTRTRFGTAA